MEKYTRQLLDRTEKKNKQNQNQGLVLELNILNGHFFESLDFLQDVMEHDDLKENYTFLLLNKLLSLVI